MELRLLVGNAFLESNGVLMASKNKFPATTSASRSAASSSSFEFMPVSGDVWKYDMSISS